MKSEVNSNGGGPRATEGKAVSRRNALKHGYRASKLLPDLVGEERFNEALNALHAELEPQGIIEEALVDQLAQILLVFDLAATGLRATIRELLRIAPQGSSDDGAASLAVSNLKTALIVRYQSEAGRNFQKNLRLFMEIKGKRLPPQEEHSAQLSSSPSMAVASSDLPSPLANPLEQVSTDADCRSFIEESRKRFPTCPNAQASTCTSDTLRSGCFLAHTGIPIRAALCVAIRLIEDQEISIAALRSNSGIRRTRTLTKLVRLIRDADRNGNDFLLLYIRQSLETKLKQEET
jgi:hypothetical protein